MNAGVPKIILIALTILMDGIMKIIKLVYR